MLQVSTGLMRLSRTVFQPFPPGCTILEMLILDVRLAEEQDMINVSLPQTCICSENLAADRVSRGKLCGKTHHLSRQK